MNTVDLDGRYIIVFNKSILKNDICLEGVAHFDGEDFFLETENGEMVNINRYVDLQELPLSGKLKDKHPNVDYYLEVGDWV